MSKVMALLNNPEFIKNVSIRHNSPILGEKFVKMLQTAVNKAPALARCTPMSITIAAYQLSELNLSPIPMHGQAYLIPYGEDCTVQIGWRGLATIAMRDGGVKAIHAEIVYKGDTFICSQGMEPSLRHELNFECDRTEKNILAIYAVATLANGEKMFEVMSKSQVDEVRKNFSKAGKGGKMSPWENSYGEMARKTVFKRLCKYLPMSEQLAEAIDIDNSQYKVIENDPSDQAEVVDDLKARLQSRNPNITPDFSASTGEVYDMQAEVIEDNGRKYQLDKGDPHMDILNAIEAGMKNGVISHKYLDIILQDKKVDTITKLKKEDALIIIHDIEDKLNAL